METFTVTTPCPECAAASEGTIRHLPVNGGAAHKADVTCPVGHHVSGNRALRILGRCPGCGRRLLRA